MGCKTFCTVFVVVFGVSVAVISMLIGSYLFPIPETPRLDEHQWWGKGQETDHEEDTSVNRMYVNLSDEILIDLKERLCKTPFLRILKASIGNMALTLNT